MWLIQWLVLWLMYATGTGIHEFAPVTLVYLCALFTFHPPYHHPHIFHHILNNATKQQLAYNRVSFIFILRHITIHEFTTDSFTPSLFGPLYGSPLTTLKGYHRHSSICIAHSILHTMPSTERDHSDERSERSTFSKLPMYVLPPLGSV